MARALKVFSTPAGFFNAVVAAPSQKAALEAWGVRENLFATGAAKVVDDPELIAKAVAQPGVIVRQPISSDAGFVAAAAKARPPQRSTTSAPAKPQGTEQPPPDRSALTAAEQDLKAVEEAWRTKLAASASERAALEAREAKLHAQHRTELEAAEKAVADARDAFRKAGG